MRDSSANSTPPVVLSGRPTTLVYRCPPKIESCDTGSGVPRSGVGSGGGRVVGTVVGTSLPSKTPGGGPRRTETDRVKRCCWGRECRKERVSGVTRTGDEGGPWQEEVPLQGRPGTPEGLLPPPRFSPRCRESVVSTVYGWVPSLLLGRETVGGRARRR